MAQRYFLAFGYGPATSDILSFVNYIRHDKWEVTLPRDSPETTLLECPEPSTRKHRRRLRRRDSAPVVKRLVSPSSEERQSLGLPADFQIYWQTLQGSWT